MTGATPTIQKVTGLALGAALITLIVNLCMISTASAVPIIEASNHATGTGTTQAATIPAATAGNVLVAICGNRGTSASMTVSSPTGFTQAIRQSGTPSQGIFYKVALGGETSVTCSFGVSGRNAIQVFEISGLVTPIVAGNVRTSSGTSSTSTYNFGSLTTATASGISLAGYIVNANPEADTWSSFTALLSGVIANGNGNQRIAYGSASQVTNGLGVTSTTTATGGAATSSRGQLIWFPALPYQTNVSIVNASNVVVGSPSVAFTARTASFSCQTSTATLGIASQKLRIVNTAPSTNWSLSLAATGGSGATWSNGTRTYTYNQPADSGCTSGQMTVDPSTATITPTAGCTNTGLTLGGATAYDTTLTQSAPLVTASGSQNNCTWDITNIGLSQTIPGEMPSGTYSLNMTLTMVAL